MMNCVKKWNVCVFLCDKNQKVVVQRVKIDRWNEENCRQIAYGKQYDVSIEFGSVCDMCAAQPLE